MPAGPQHHLWVDGGRWRVRSRGALMTGAVEHQASFNIRQIVLRTASLFWLITSLCASSSDAPEEICLVVSRSRSGGIEPWISSVLLPLPSFMSDVNRKPAPCRVIFLWLPTV